MKNTFRVIPHFIFVLFLCSIGNAQGWKWAKHAGCTGIESNRGIDVDASGNTYLTGEFTDTMSFGAKKLTTSSKSIYIAKYDVNGNLVWASRAVESKNIFVSSICVDNLGNTTIVGRYSDTAFFGAVNPKPLISIGSFDVYIAKYDINGDLIWMQSTGGLGYDFEGAISSDANNNIYITGDFHKTSYEVSPSKIFIAKYDRDGTQKWLMQSDNYENAAYGHGITSDSIGNSYFIGSFFHSLSFDSTHIVNAENPEANIFIGKMNTDGEVLWLQKAGAGSGYSAGKRIDVDASGNVYAIGFYKGTINFGAFSITAKNNGSYDGFVAKCDNEGNYLWATDIPSASTAGIVVNSKGEWYITGLFNTSIIFGPTVLTNMGSSDIYIAKADKSGVFEWATQCKSELGASVLDIKIHEDDILISGVFKDTLNFGSLIPLVSDINKYDIFVAKMSSSHESVNESKHPVLTFYPNPAANELHLTGISNGTNYVVYDLLGNSMLQGKTDESNVIPIYQLNVGTYMVSFTTPSGSKILFNAIFTKMSS